MLPTVLLVFAPLGLAGGLAQGPVWAADVPPEPPRAAEPPELPNAAELQACARLRVDADRLACYDAALRRPPPQDEPPLVERAWGAGFIGARDVSADLASSRYLASYWELDRSRKQGTFNFIGYRPNFFLPLMLQRRVNRTPTSPNPQNQGALLPDYKRVETKVQLSIRTKLAQGVLLRDADLWFAYTQQSMWQLWSPSISAPFRSTDHEPELIYVVPTPADLPLGWKLRLSGLGFAHQSNGQALPLSRSWNRLYAMAGFERDEYSLMARLNQRLSEDDETDDNPDLTRYRGRLDLLAAWTPGLATATLLWRTNLDRRGSVQLDWTFPVDSQRPGGLRYYVQAFHGHAQTLLDYNIRQTAIGAGVTLFGW